MKKYKVLTKDLKSPFRVFQYQIGKEYICEDFDESNKECSTGFYATDIEGLLYCLNNNNNKVFEVEVSGKSKVFDQFKQRYEKQTILREILTDELQELVKVESDKLSYDLYHAIFPFNPLKGEAKEVTQEIKDLFDEWINVKYSVIDSVEDSDSDSDLDSVINSIINSIINSVGDSVWNSVGDSVWDSVMNYVRDSDKDSVGKSVGESIKDSVGDSVVDSVGESVYAYIGSLFPEIKQWKGVKHKKGVYPFQSGVDLWNKGFVPSFKGTILRLHSGEDGKIVYEKDTQVSKEPSCVSTLVNIC